MILNIFLLCVSLAILAFAANYLVQSSINLARQFNLSEMFIGLTLVSMGTSAPEVAVSVKAALDGAGSLSVGNVIGSNIFNLGFILGLVAIISAQKIHKKMVYRDGFFLLLVSILALFLLWDHYVSFWEGILLIALMIGYISYLFINKEISEDVPEKIERAWWIDALIFLVSLAGLIYASDMTVTSSSYIASYFGVSEWAIGATIVAAGTSLPEVAASVVATLKRKFDISIGNVIGSDIFNTLGIIGISSVVAPITLDANHFVLGIVDHSFSQILMILTLIIILFFLRTGWTLSRKEGAFLFVFAILRMGFEIYIGQL